MEEHRRQQRLLDAVGDVNSLAYRSVISILEDAEAVERRARQMAPYVVLPFVVPERDVSALEKQFSVTLKLRGVLPRMVATPRVAGMIFLLEGALLEHAGGAGRTVLLVDGDMMTAAAVGVEGRLIERTFATPRLISGYFSENEGLMRHSSPRTSRISVVTDMLLRELKDGGGEHFWPHIRLDGPKVDSVAVNHFKTPVGPKQVAWLAHNRGAMVYGTIFFQFDMLTKLEGVLDCFPGRFYVDKEADLITLVPDEDASLSISHPYGAWKEIVYNNVITAGGKEFLCEKYKPLKGILFYTLSPVDTNFEAPEVLRTHYFDPSSVGLTELSFPRAKMSKQGVPIGWERGIVRILTERFDKVLSRLMSSSSNVVTPGEAFIALMDYNNTVVNSLDTVTFADRMSVDDENDAALAIALHVNWSRHAMHGTFNVLLDAVRRRRACAETEVYKFAGIALATWWSSPNVGSKVHENVLPENRVLDFLGNDFSVNIYDVDPWIEVAQVAGNAIESGGKQYSWFPRVPETDGWYNGLVTKARELLRSGGAVNPVVAVVVDRSVPALPVPTKLLSSGLIASTARPVVTYVDENEMVVVRPAHDLTKVKELFKQKMRQDQAAISEVLPVRGVLTIEQVNSSVLPDIPVVNVDPVSAIQTDFDMCNKGWFDRDAVKTGFRLAEVDIDKHTEGVFSINDSKRLVPTRKWIRRPVVDMGVEGKRVPSQAALMGAMFKRNVGVPSNRGTVDLDATPKYVVDRIIEVCYREDWKQILEKHLDTGLWQANDIDIEDFVANADEKKVRTMLDEFFLESSVDLYRWQLMAKGKIKASREAHADLKVDHSQTIMYLESGNTNAMYSAMTRRFKEVVDECLRPEVCLNAQRSDEEHEDWYNSLEAIRIAKGKTYSYASDIKCFDRSQEHVPLRVDVEFYKRHGLTPERLRIWETTHGPKRAAAMMFGVVLWMTLGGVSGIWKTIMRNGIITLGSLVVSANLRREDVVMIDVKGDDGDFEFSRPVRVETTVERMSLTFNLSAKFFTADVRYMCKTFRVKVNGRWYFVADPWARAQSLCTPLWVGNHEDSLTERWISLKADLRHYDNGLLVDTVAEVAQVYYATERPLYGFARGLAMIAADKNLYMRFFKSEEYVD